MFKKLFTTFLFASCYTPFQAVVGSHQPSNLIIIDHDNEDVQMATSFKGRAPAAGDRFSRYKMELWYILSSDETPERHVTFEEPHIEISERPTPPLETTFNRHNPTTAPKEHLSTINHTSTVQVLVLQPSPALNSAPNPDQYDVNYSKSTYYGTQTSQDLYGKAPKKPPVAPNSSSAPNYVRPFKSVFCGVHTSQDVHKSRVDPNSLTYKTQKTMYQQTSNPQFGWSQDLYEHNRLSVEKISYDDYEAFIAPFLYVEVDQNKRKQIFSAFSEALLFLKPAETLTPEQACFRFSSALYRLDISDVRGKLYQDTLYRLGNCCNEAKKIITNFINFYETLLFQGRLRDIKPESISIYKTNKRIIEIGTRSYQDAVNNYTQGKDMGELNNFEHKKLISDTLGMLHICQNDINVFEANNRQILY